MGQDAASWRVSLDISTSRGLSGGHPETEGITPSGEVIGTVLHAHEVELDLTRYELGITRTFDKTWDAFLRIPYFIKDQTAAVVFPNGGTPGERDAAIRSGFAHHRTDLYEGFSDFEAGVGYRKHGTILGQPGVFRISLGVTLPVGEPKAEFFVEEDKTVSIKFYDKENKVVAPAAQSVTATVDAKGKKTKLEFAKKGDALVSSAKIPEGDANPIVVQVKTAADAKPQNFRFKLDLSKCGGCPNPEYACTCEDE